MNKNNKYNELSSPSSLLNKSTIANLLKSHPNWIYPKSIQVQRFKFTSQTENKKTNIQITF